MLPAELDLVMTDSHHIRLAGMAKWRCTSIVNQLLICGLACGFALAAVVWMAEAYCVTHVAAAAGSGAQNRKKSLARQRIQRDRLSWPRD